MSFSGLSVVGFAVTNLFFVSEKDTELDLSFSGLSVSILSIFLTCLPLHMYLLALQFYVNLMSADCYVIIIACIVHVGMK